MNLDLYRPLEGGPATIVTRGLCRRFGNDVALDGLDLTVPEGAVYVLVGPNGAGKTTTLRTLLDLVRPDAGEARIFGQPVGADGPELRGRIGYVPDTHDFGYGNLRVDHLLDHHATYYPTWDAAYAEELVDQLDIRRSVKYGKLSKGQARRVQLVLALAHRPALLLLDEPTDGLDPVVREIVLTLLIDHLATTPTTVLVSTHLIHEVEGIGDTLGALRQGRLVAQLGRDELELKLNRYLIELREGTEIPTELGERILRRKDGPREAEWILWGDRDAASERLRAGGATVREVRPLGLEEATRVLLTMGGRS